MSVACGAANPQFEFRVLCTRRGLETHRSPWNEMATRSIMNDMSISHRNSRGLLRILFSWIWLTIGIVGLAVEGLLAFVSLAFVGIVSFAFVLHRLTHLRSVARRCL